MRSAGIALLCLVSLGVAAYAVVAYTFVPLGSLVHPEMRATFESNKIGIYTHILASAVALSLGPFQFLFRLREKHKGLHRWSGRVYLGVGVLLGGLAGFYMALHAFGGVLSQVGFALLALAWLYSGLRAYLAIRGRDPVAHRRWMIRNFALTLAAVTLRLYLPASMAAGISFELVYPIVAWLCWLPNLIVAELLINKSSHTPVHRADVNASG